VDVIAKYVERLLGQKDASTSGANPNLDDDPQA